MENRTLIIGLVVVLVAGGIVAAVVRKQNNESTAQEDEKQAMMKKEEDAAMKQQEAMKKDESAMMEVMKMAMSDSASLKTVLKDVTGGSSTGMAYVLRKDGKIFHTVTATLPNLPANEFYEGWLVKNPATKEFFSTGKLIKQPDGTYELSYTANNTYESYNTVVITSEKVMDAEPEKHVLEGTVK